MGILFSVLGVLLFLFCVYLFLIAPNVLRRKVRVPALLGWHYAHRGLHDDNESIPENSLAAFRLAVEHGYGIELDVHLTKDKQLVVHHDNSVKRLCGEDARLSEMTLEETRKYNLANTGEGIPSFDEVLAVVDGKIPMIIELKSDKQGDTELARLLHERMRSYRGVYCVESFDPLLMRWYKRNAPEVARGQLAHDPSVKKGKYANFRQFAMAHLLLNFLSRPDFVAYSYQSDVNCSFRLMRAMFRPLLVAWTVREPAVFERLKECYDLQIFEAMTP